MTKNLSLWRRLSRVEGLSATRPQWRAALDEHFHAFEPYLRPTSRGAAGVPCPTQCDDACYRRVVEHGRNDMVGVCRQGGRSVSLSPKDVVIYEVHTRLLADTIAAALRVEPGHV